MLATVAISLGVFVVLRSLERAVERVRMRRRRRVLDAFRAALGRVDLKVINREPEINPALDNETRARVERIAKIIDPERT